MNLSSGAPHVVAHKDFIIVGNNVMTMEDANILTTKLIECIDQARAYREVHMPATPRDVMCPHCGYAWKTRIVPGGAARCAGCHKSFLTPYVSEESNATQG